MKTYHTVGEVNGEGRGEERMERRDGTTRAKGGACPSPASVSGICASRVWERHSPDKTLGSRFDVRNAAAVLPDFDVSTDPANARILMLTTM